MCIWVKLKIGVSREFLFGDNYFRQNLDIHKNTNGNHIEFSTIYGNAEVFTKNWLLWAEKRKLPYAHRDQNIFLSGVKTAH